MNVRVPDERLTLEHPATPQAVADVRHAVLGFVEVAGLQSAVSGDDVALAVSEAATNVVHHAYRNDDRPGPVLVEAFVEDDALVVTVGDQGCGMLPRLDSPGVGLGLPVISRVTSALEIQDSDGPRGGVTLRMAFALAS